MQLSLLNWVLAFTPIALILILMLAFNWGGSRAGAAGWFATVALAMLRFGAEPILIAYTQTKAVLLALDVLYIIWTALLLFHIANEAGAIRVISEALLSVTADHTIQGLLLGWIFVSFLQGMGGFGVPVAVTAPLLVGVGFNPIQAVLMASIGHGWSVNFGSMGSSFQTLIAITGLEGRFLAPETALILGLSCLLCGVLVALIAGGVKGVVRNIPFIALVGMVMGSVQYLLATGGIWSLGATGGAMAGLLCAVLILRRRMARQAPGEVKQEAQTTRSRHSLLIALSSYTVLVVLAFAINLIPSLHSFLNHVKLSLQFPELQTAYGYVTPAEPGRSISLFGHPGTVLVYSSLISYWIYRLTGFLKPGGERKILSKVGKGALKSSLGILAMVGMAVVMSHSGMVNLLAQGMSHAFGKTFFPLAAPFIGALGAFITGSNNNSNVLFAAMQHSTAQILGLSVPLILAAQTSGASLGSIFAPAKVIVGCSTVGLGSHEGEVMRKILVYGLSTILFVAVLTMIFGWLI